MESQLRVGEETLTFDVYDLSIGKSFSMKQCEFLQRLAMIAEERFAHPVIVNIGVLLGCSMAWLRTGSPSCILVGIDIDLQRRHPGLSLLSYLKAILLEMDSQQASENFWSTPHLVFVDGGHSRAIAGVDMEAWSDKLPVGGIIAIHDLHMGQVKAAFDEWHDPNTWSEIDKPPCPGFRAFERVK